MPPETDCPSIHERLVLYKLAHCQSVEALDALHEELMERFGLMPDATRTQRDNHRPRIEAKPPGIVKSENADARFRRRDKRAGSPPDAGDTQPLIPAPQPESERASASSQGPRFRPERRPRTARAAYRPPARGSRTRW